MSHLDYLIRQDVEHGTFSPRNIFNDEYLTPQFYTYAKQLEEQIDKMKNCENCRYNCIENGEEYCDSPNGVCKRYSSTFDKDNWECAE